MNTLYKIKKDEMLLSPKNGRPIKTINAIRKVITKWGCRPVFMGNYNVKDNDIARWNNHIQELRYFKAS